MPTPTISVLPQPIQGNVLIMISWSASANVNRAAVLRNNLDGTQTPVRTNTSTGGDTSGTYIELSAGIAILYDTEMPFNTALTYTTIGFDSALNAISPDSATSPEVIVQASGFLWLRDPIYPAGNLRIGLTPPPGLPECVPGEGLFFVGMGDRNHGVQGTNWSVNNRRTPILLGQVRAAPTSSLPLVLRTFADYDLLVALLATGESLELWIPDKYGYETGYVAVGDLVVTRLSRDYRQQWQGATLPYATVDRPGGMSYGTLGTRWVDMCSIYPTFADATAAGLTWQGALLGQASLSALPAAWRTWGNVNADFATWGAVNTGGRTWANVLVGV